MSPWNVRNTFLAWGAGFKKRATVRTPVGNVDVAPTILSLLGMPDSAALDGRVLAEALDGGADPEQIAVETRVHTVESGSYRAATQISTVDGRRYVDKSWRIR
jgi:arylsulfatase A-like enzyme